MAMTVLAELVAFTFLVVGFVTVGVFFESLLNSLFLIIVELTILVGIKLVHEFSLEVILHGFLLVVINLAVLVGIELVHELGLASFHESLAVRSHLRCGGRLRSGSNLNGGNDLRSGTRCRLGLLLLREHRQSGHKGEDE